MSELAELFLELEISGADESDLFSGSGEWLGSGEFAGIEIRLTRREDGHGFGLSMVIGIVLSVGIGTASNIAADALRSAVKRVIIRAKGSRGGESDGSPEGLVQLIETERGGDNPDGDLPAEEDEAKPL